MATSVVLCSMKRKFWSWPGNSSEQRRCFILAYTFLSTEIGDPWEYPITTFYFIQDRGADRSHSFYRNTSFINKEVLSLWFFSNTHSPPCCPYVVYFGKELPDGPQLRTGVSNYHCSALPARAGISQGIFLREFPNTERNSGLERHCFFSWHFTFHAAHTNSHPDNGVVLHSTEHMLYYRNWNSKRKIV